MAKTLNPEKPEPWGSKTMARARLIIQDENRAVEILVQTNIPLADERRINLLLSRGLKQIAKLERDIVELDDAEVKRQFDKMQVQFVKTTPA